ncbi:MAG: hypothetical protein ACYCO3_00530 [Mycobacteriales bacterium]
MAHERVARTRTAIPSRRADRGADGNARLTGAAGSLLFILLAVEGATILRIRSLIDLHVFIGFVLIPPVLLKVASTGYRMLRYYSGHAAYRRRGAPMTLLRVLGPVVVVLTLIVIGTGVGLLTVSPRHPGWLLGAHKGSFVLWFLAMAVHVLAHLRETVVLAWRDWRPGRVERGTRARRLAILASLIAGVALGAALLPSAAAWHHLAFLRR